MTLRVRLGGEVKAEGFSLLAEGEGTVALDDHYSDTLPGNGVEPYPTVPDPENIELNRLQVSYMKNGTGVTVGRQRIILDNARFVGNVGWRQNEQTFDAIRGQASLGPVHLDATYAISQRTVFGYHSPNEHFDGDLVFLNGGVDTKHLDAKAFAYLLDYDARLAFSSQTYGVLVTAVSPKAFSQALGMVRRGGTVSLNGLPPGDFPLDIFGMVLNGITVRGSIVGTRLDLQESLDFAAQGKVAATVHTDRLENINDIFARMHAGKIEGRVVLDMAS